MTEFPTEVRTADDYKDSVRPARVKAVSAFGFTERQARFLVNVMVHSGVFLERQYCAFAGISHGQKTHDFMAKLTGRRYARAITPGALHRGRLFHLHYKPLYEAIDEPNNRHRKTVSLGRMIERLMILDAVLADTNYTWLGTENDKLRYFMGCLIPQSRLRKDEYPHIAFGESERKTVRYFPDKLPIGIEKPGFGRHVFLYLVTREVPMEFRMFLLSHAELLRAINEWTIRLLIPRRFRKAAALYRYAFRDEVATPLHPSIVDQLKLYFPAHQEAPGHLSEPADEELAKAFQRFGAARFRALYRMWQREGDGALWNAFSPHLRDALVLGRGRLECVDLSHQYLQLTSLVGVS